MDCRSAPLAAFLAIYALQEASALVTAAIRKGVEALLFFRGCAGVIDAVDFRGGRLEGTLGGGLAKVTVVATPIVIEAVC